MIQATKVILVHPFLAIIQSCNIHQNILLSLILLLEMLQVDFASVMREKPPEEVVVFPHPAKSVLTTASAHADNAIATRFHRNSLENAARLKKPT